MQIDHIHETEVLVIGGGAAALRAALASCEHGAQTTVVLKGETGKSGATVSPDSPGVAWQVAGCCSNGEDSPEVHYLNILDASLGMADPRLARILAYETLERTEELQRWGLQFILDPNDNLRHYTGYSCFSDQPRAHGIANSGYGHAGDIVRVLVQQIKQYDLDLHENILISDLIVEDGCCVGAVGVGADGEIIVYRAGAVVLAAGGARQIFPSEPGRSLIDTTGDSYAMALRAGAELTNMEFMQYMLHPIRPFPVSVPGVFWALCPTLKNRDGDDALQPHLPDDVESDQVMRERTLHYPFSSRDRSKWLDVAFAHEIRAGRGSDQGGLYLDFSGVDRYAFQPSRPQHLPEDRKRLIELPKHLVQVRSVAHAINGGVLIDEKAETSVSGLFALAETAAGPHGADRLGGCMVSGGQVFGARAGRFAAYHALSNTPNGLSARALKPLLARFRKYGHGNGQPDDVLSALQQATGRNLIVTKNQQGLQSLAETIRELSEQQLPQVAVTNACALRRAIEVSNSLTTAELMTRAAMTRTESRGSHFREDFPQQDDNHWRGNIIFRLTNNNLQQEIRSLADGITKSDPSRVSEVV